MIEKEKSPAELHQQRQCLVQKFITKGLHEEISEKTLNIGVAWVFGPSNLREIADSYNETRANASLHNIDFFKQVWHRLSREEQPPIRDFTIRKTARSMKKPRRVKYEMWSSGQVVKSENFRTGQDQI